MELTVKQTQALDKLEDCETNEAVFGGGAGGGKSILGSYWLLKMVLKFPGTRWVMGRSKLKNLKQTTLNSFLEVCKEQKITSKHFRINSQEGIIHFYNESQILLKDLFLYPSDPEFDDLGSLEITGAFVDECNQITYKAWQILKSRIRYKLDEYGLVPKILGTCNPSRSWVYSRFYKPAFNGELPSKLAFIQSLLTDNKYISKHYKENLLSLDEKSKQRLLYGNWEYDDDPAAIFDYVKIQDTLSNQFILGGEKFISADIARKGKDKTIICIWNGWILEKIYAFEQNLVDEIAVVIRNLQKKHAVPNSHTIVDEDGVGGGVVDILRCIGFVNNGTAYNGENYANKRAQCYFTLAKKVNANEIKIIADLETFTLISEELSAFKDTSFQKDIKKNVSTREQIMEMIGRSPDYGSAIMMRCHFEFAKSSKILAYG